MKEFIDSLRRLGVRTLSCCCGHGKYKMSVVVDFGFSKLLPVEIFSGIELSRKKKFYKKDKQEYYYIPETIQSNQRICECSHKEWDEHKCSFEPMVAQECNVKGCKCKKFKFHKKDKQRYYYYYIPETKNAKDSF